MELSPSEEEEARVQEIVSEDNEQTDTQRTHQSKEQKSEKSQHNEEENENKEEVGMVLLQYQKLIEYMKTQL